MSTNKVYTIVETAYSYNDEIYSLAEGVRPISAYKNKETAIAECEKQNLDFIRLSSRDKKTTLPNGVTRINTPLDEYCYHYADLFDDAGVTIIEELMKYNNIVDEDCWVDALDNADNNQIKDLAIALITKPFSVIEIEYKD